MRAVHFGAGNIGRGFIGMLLYQAGYHTTFIDVNQSLIDEINEKQQYQIVLAAEKQEFIQVGNISAINSKTNPEDVHQAIVEADIITTAIGPSILPLIAALIAEGMRKRVKENQQPLNIIACENMIGGSSFLQEKVYAFIPEAEKTLCRQLFGFPDAAVDRIIPNQMRKQSLEVAVEPYFEWVVDETAMKGENPVIDGLTYVQDLQAYIERKLFTVNTGHAVPAYMGWHLGYETIEHAMQDANILTMIQGVLDETGEALIRVHGFDRKKHESYKQTIIERFKNPYVSDEVTRVGRNPIRKLGAKDRLVYPAQLYMKNVGELPYHLVKLMAFALLYDVKEDEESLQLQQMVSKLGYERTLTEVTGLQAGEPLFAAILKEIQALT